jgi:hypothetical protein
LVCYRCNGTDHLADKCRFKESTCNQCHRKRHIRVAFRSGGQKKKPQHRNQRVHALNHEENDDLEIYSVYSHGNDSIWIKPCVNGNIIPMELDHYNDNKPIWALVAAVIVPDFFFCGHPALYERECHLEHFAILLHF